MSDLELLLEKVRAAEEGSALLDAEFYATVGGAPHTTKAGVRTVPLIMKGDPHEWPDYTTSLDAIVALIERELPGWAWSTGTCSVSDDAWVAPDFNSPVHGERLRSQFDESKWHEGVDIDRRPSGSPALALCAAFLSAKIQTGSGETGNE